MISFRYHLVSIVAVFLALGLGLLAGTTVIDKRLVDNLKRQTGVANARADQYQGLVGDLQAATSALIPPLVTGQLSGDKVVIIQYPGTDGKAVSEAKDSLSMAGADIVAQLQVLPSTYPQDAATQKSLATLLGLDPSTSPEILAAEAASRLGDRLAAGFRGNPKDDLLNGMLNGQFIATVPPTTIGPQDLPKVGGAGEIIVLLAGGSSSPSVPVANFMLPLAQELVKQKALVAAGEAPQGAYAFVSILRADGSVDGHIVTVDDLDQNYGGAALVLGLRDLISSGRGGDFGTQGNAVLIPQPTPGP